MQGEEQKKLDVLSNEVLKNALRSTGEERGGHGFALGIKGIFTPPPCRGMSHEWSSV